MVVCSAWTRARAWLALVGVSIPFVVSPAFALPDEKTCRDIMEQYRVDAEKVAAWQDGTADHILETKLRNKLSFWQWTRGGSSAVEDYAAGLVTKLDIHLRQGNLPKAIRLIWGI